MKNCLLIANILLLAIYLLLFSGCKASQSNLKTTSRPVAVSGPASETDNKKVKMDRLKKKIEQAVLEAQKNGRDRVDIYLDENPEIVQFNDVVQVAYTATLENGRQLTSGSETRQILAGEKTKIPGLGNAVLDMKFKEKKQVVLQPQNAFGAYQNNKVEIFSATRTYQSLMEISAEEYQKKTGKIIKKGDVISISPYFKSTVVQTNGDKLLIQNKAQNGLEERIPFGKTTVRSDDDTIVISLEAKVGAAFPKGKKKGLIVSADKRTFTVDFNHPFSGQTLQLDLEILSLEKASSFAGIELDWIDDHDQGYAAARKANKKKVLVLYAEWCDWCEKMFQETFRDPRIKKLKDEFIWVKANSDVDKSLKSFYGQKSFPMIVLADSKGAVLKKIDGYKDAPSLLKELESILNTDVAHTKLKK